MSYPGSLVALQEATFLARRFSIFGQVRKGVGRLLQSVDHPAVTSFLLSDSPTCMRQVRSAHFCGAVSGNPHMGRTEYMKPDISSGGRWRVCREMVPDHFDCMEVSDNMSVVPPQQPHPTCKRPHGTCYRCRYVDLPLPVRFAPFPPPCRYYVI